MHKIIVTGCGTDVGKTVVSAILATLLQGDYWKPVQSGSPSDTEVMSSLLDLDRHVIHPSSYSCKTPISPHHAAQLEQIEIQTAGIIPPQTIKPLIIEGVGGLYSPITFTQLNIDFFKRWGYPCVVVSKNYLGSINHTLLTLAALKQQGIPVLGVVFNGTPTPESEEVILSLSHVPLLGRVLPEPIINTRIIQHYAHQWSSHDLFSRSRSSLPLAPFYTSPHSASSDSYR